MPSKAYSRFKKNMETVERLCETYNLIRQNREGKGKAAWDHITRSAIIFLVSSFEVYVEDVANECCNLHIRHAGDAEKLPNKVKNEINNFVKNDRNEKPPIELCDEGWRKVYRDISADKTKKLNTPKVKNISLLFISIIGLSKEKVSEIEDIDKLDSIIEFRGEIAHRCRADKYVKKEKVEQDKQIINNITIAIDKALLAYLKNKYSGKRIWYETY